MSRFLAGLGPLLGRALLSLIFLYSGYHKVLVAPGRAAAAIAGKGIPFSLPAAYAAGGFELVVGALVVLGLRARMTALAAFVYLVGVTYLLHWHPAARGDAAQALQALKNAGLAGGMLLLASYGPGPASIDRG